jgi:hypothetical protein
MKLHIGKEIESRYKESGIKLAEFARRLNTSPRNVYAIFERPDIKTDLLQKIGEVLKFNFFGLYTQQPYRIENVNEPEMEYLKFSPKSDSLSVIVSLDGNEDTLNQWVKKLTAINKTIAPKS